MTGVPFDPEAIRALAQILADTGLTEIEIAHKEGRIRVARQPAPISAAVALPAPVMPAAAPVAAAAPALAPIAAPATTLAEADATHPGAITSPMVGVAYLAPEPGAQPFVAVGQAVTAGQTVLLIEAMKTFNQIKAPKAGTVARIHIQSGAPVEYGEVLLVVE